MSKMIIVAMHISEKDFAKEFINKNIKIRWKNKIAM
jgi:hypothetical protein